MDRYKDIQFASRLNNQIARQLETHRLRHIISELAKQLPPDKRADNAVREMTAYGCTTRMHVVQLLAQRLDNERPMKEMDFSPASIRARWQAGHADASQALARTDWLGDFSPLEGVNLAPSRSQGRPRTHKRGTHSCSGFVPPHLRWSHQKRTYG